ncbi:hypothetical protein MNBD_GAMMA12-3696 [hydrothermal vent metagenome]|uniref:Uncharacterized protein n=1 Tax=hydrothermal vent metagenome TaxID=652676 RepID=A0A3B0YY29_9ZZZZ
MSNEHTKNTQRYWNIQLTCIILLIPIILASINYLIDPYQIFHTNILLPSSTSNERFNKVEYLLKNKQKYNSFLLGSSRMGVFHPQWFNYKGYQFYNLSVFSGDAKDSLQMLTLLKKKGVKVKKVVVGLDLFPFIEKQRLRPASLQHHPQVAKIDNFDFYVKQLFSASFYQSYLKIEQHYGERSFTFNYTTGQWSLNAFDRLRQKDPKQYQRIFFKKSLKPPLNVIFQEKRFTELNQLIVWLNKYNIQAEFFIHPFSQLHQNHFTHNTFKKLHQRIKILIPNVIDFSGKKDWTHNTNNYYERIHYRTKLAKTIAIKLKNLTMTMEIISTQKSQ